MSFNLKKKLAFWLLQFYDAAKAAKKAFTQAEKAFGIKQFYRNSR